jgi:hypothetical protein
MPPTTNHLLNFQESDNDQYDIAPSPGYWRGTDRQHGRVGRLRLNAQQHQHYILAKHHDNTAPAGNHDDDHDESANATSVIGLSCILGVPPL